MLVEVAIEPETKEFLIILVWLIAILFSSRQTNNQRKQTMSLSSQTVEDIAVLKLYLETHREYRARYGDSKKAYECLNRLVALSPTEINAKFDELKQPPA